ncbi:MAG: hypothetical protein ACFE8M_09800 [Candidatus Hermodarchaeota archaeon]
MGIKKRKTIYILILIGGLLVFISPHINRKYGSLVNPSQSSGSLTPNSIHTSSHEYICKVFTFTQTQDTYTLSFDLLSTYMHNIIVSVVTPHSCYMNITLWDSSNREFQIFYTYISQIDGEFTIPFGTAVAGNYTFMFRATLEENLNIKIKILREDVNCLYDKITQHEYGNIIFYEVTCFSDGFFISHEVFFRTDRSYKFYIGRVSSISMNLSSKGSVIYNIIDPNAIPFAIYENNTLASVASVNIFSFGTAIEGTYTVGIRIYCEVEWMNVAYAIVDNGPICNPPSSDDNQTSITNNFSVPFDLGLYTIIGAGLVAGALVLAVVHYRKKTDMSLKFKEK